MMFAPISIAILPVITAISAAKAQHFHQRKCREHRPTSNFCKQNDLAIQTGPGLVQSRWGHLEVDPQSRHPMLIKRSCLTAALWCCDHGRLD